MPTASIIVPIYNAQPFLNNCIQTILAQSFTDFELVLVDDGSTDDSLKICRAFAEQDSRISIVLKPNGGVSSARNAGIEKAKGKYIAFADSDDELCESYLSLLIKNIENADIAIGAMRLLDVDKNIVLSVCDKKYNLNEFKNDAKNTFKGQCVNSPCNKLFKAELINKHNLRFCEEVKMGEDAIFVIAYLQKCSKINTFSDIIYIYRRGDDSGLRKPKKSDDAMLQNRILMCQSFQQFYQGCGYIADVLLLREFLSAILQDLQQNDNISNKILHFETFIDDTGLNKLIDVIKVPFYKKALAYQWLTLLQKRKYKEYLQKYGGISL